MRGVLKVTDEPIEKPARRLNSKELFDSFTKRRSDQSLSFEGLSAYSANHFLMRLIPHKNMCFALEDDTCRHCMFMKMLLA